MDDAPISLRDQVVELLHQCGDEKRLLSPGGLGKCLTLAETAYQLSGGDLPRCKPWRELAAYRCAHLLMWIGKATRFGQAVDLFMEAAGTERCPGAGGPVALIYAAAALSRQETANRTESSSRVRELIERAGQWMRQLPRAGRAWQQIDTNLHADGFNMFELAAYLTGFRLEGFRGVGSLELRNPSKDNGWVVKTTVGAGGNELVTELLARTELDYLRSQFNGILTIELGYNRKTAEMSIGQGEPLRVPATRAKILIRAMELRGGDKVDLLRSLSMTQSDQRFRTALRRLNAELKSIVPSGRRLIKISRSGRIDFDPRVKVAAAVQLSALR